LRFAKLSFLTAAASSVFAAPIAFEPVKDGFAARGPARAVLTRERVNWPSAGVSMSFESARRGAAGEGLDRTSGHASYIIGNDPSQWRLNVPRFARVRFRGVYSKTDVVYHGSGNDLEFDFVLAPGAAPDRLRLRFDAAAVAFARDGSLVAKGPRGEVRLRAPLAWQQTNGGRHAIKVRFRRISENIAGFDVEDAYDRTRALIIDPILQVATYYGGSGNETNVQMLTDPSGNVYLAGTTDSNDLPQTTFPGAPLNRPIELVQTDCFLARMRPDGTELDWAVYFGGSSGDSVIAFARDGLGFLHVLGNTNSPNFPVKPNAWHNKILGASADTFWAKFDPESGNLVAATFLGIPGVSNLGTLSAFLAVDSVGDPYIAGSPAPSDFKPTPGAYPFTGNPASGSNAFVIRLNSSGTAPIYATLFQVGFITSIQVDATGGLYIGGNVNGSGFPSQNPLPGTSPPPSGNIGFVVRLNPGGSALTFASPLGLTVSSVSIDPSGNIHVLGTATNLGFAPVNPVHLGPSGPLNGAPQYWVTLQAGTNGLLAATLFDDGSPAPLELTFLPNGSTCMFVSGAKFTQAPGGLVAQAPGSSFYQTSGALTCLDQNGAQYFTTYAPSGIISLSNGLSLIPASLAPAPDGGVWIGGASNGVLPTTPNVFQPVFGGGYTTQFGFPGDAAVMKLSPLNPTPALTSVDPPVTVLGAQTFYLNGSGFGSGTQVLWNGNPVAATFLDSKTLSFQVTDPNLLAAGTVTITASLPAPGGGVSNAMNLELINPAPFALTVSPPVVNAGSAAINLLVAGNNMLSTATVTWDGQPRSATYVPATFGIRSSFQIAVSASELAQAGNHTIVVTNPGPGGGPVTAIFAVAGSVPTLHILAAAPQVAGLPADSITITLSTSGVTTGATATWDGTPVSVNISSPTSMTLRVPAALVVGSSRHTATVSAGGQSASTVVYVAVGLASATGNGVAIAVDTAQRKLYNLVQQSFPSTQEVLEIWDLATLQPIATINVPGPVGQMIVTDDGSFVYFLGNSTISRFNAATLAFDFQFTIDVNVYGYVTAIAALPGQPDSIVAVVSNAVTIFDQGVPRGNTAAAVYGGSVVAVTADRIYLGQTLQAGRTCLSSVGYDQFGTSGPLTYSCDPTQLGLKQDSLLTYLPVGSGVVTISFGAGLSIPARGVFPDLADRHAIVWTTNGLADWNLDTLLTTPLLNILPGFVSQIDSRRVLVGYGAYFFIFDPANP
jgi:hypothetical protein